MKKIRIGKDLQVKWTILTNGKSEDLSGRDLTLFLFDPLKYSRQVPFEVSANVISFTVRGTECAGDFVGYYKFKVLEELFVHGVKASNTAFSETPYINYDSIKYEVDNASNTKAITITVHPTTYGYLTGTIEPTEQVGGTTEEWQQIVTDAAEKQISFATE